MYRNLKNPLTCFLAFILLVGYGSSQIFIKQKLQKPRKPWLGVYLTQSDEGLVEINKVIKGSPADKAGLKKGDKILAFQGKPLSSINSLIEQVLEKRPGQEVVFRVLRGDKKLNIQVKLGATPGIEKRIKAPQRKVFKQRIKRADLERGRITPLKSLDQFEEILELAKKPVLFIFNAPWCGPGKVLKENLNKPPARNILGMFDKIVEINVDDFSKLADRYGVDSIPHLQILGRKGRKLGRIIGVIDPEGLYKALKNNLKSKPGKKVLETRERGETDHDVDRAILNELRRIRRLLEEIRDRLGG